MDDYYDLGTYSFPVTTRSEQAQVWFDRGLNWTYGYNHEAAVICFRKAIEADAQCAMAHWGVAYASGPNYNLPWWLLDDVGRTEQLAIAYDATREAMALVDQVTPLEADLIKALRARYPERDPAPISVMKTWNDAFADVMRGLLHDHPASFDVRAIAAEALLNRTPWKMWDLAAGQPAEGADTLECEKVLEAALDNDPAALAHPGLTHLYVHLMEMSPYPERALRASDALRTLVPDAGHLVHMPTHIDALCGYYRDVVHWNEVATKADHKYWAEEGPYNVYTGYRLHNYHFIIYGALFLGQIAPAQAALSGIRETVPEDLLRIESPPMADYFESYLSFEPHVLVRFGLWDEAKALELPVDTDLFCTLTANIHYARGVAHAATGDVVAAEAEEELFIAAKARVPDTRRLHNNRVNDLLEVALNMLRGEIDYRKGAYEAAFAALRAAVAADEALAYDEPWGWMQPPRHALGALLLEQGHTDEAEAAFRADLGLGGEVSRSHVHPDNVWALRGLESCLSARGETLERRQILDRLARAQARADRTVKASCFCAQAAGAAKVA
ncbi:MAG: hypothetical protein AAF667_03700 [Pseudomonadota bacterium]